MCKFVLAALAALIVGCAGERAITPREYLDEETAATITVVADPWIFNREGTTPQLDFINLYAIDVNRMGDHRQYLVVVQYWPAPEWTLAQPRLEIRAAEEAVILQPLADSPREIGVGRPLDSSAPRSAAYWFYPVERALLEDIARTRHTSVALLLEHSERASYVVWRDGSAELNEFAIGSLADDP